ncbi:MULTISPECIES: DUF3019 domain-containing protein [Colwellia]|uniref:DUF3019 domain-containing protein n=1 Tax=Colwellia marinimaniae TaxID=1513592 RepID=A0ABQ0MTY8_9GAMM|nr:MULTISPECIES: DUF3019 domain-containing protein [Colwellia]GAW95836.1 hypothetical protein MTCD1_01439 [Colwellia marinimaniae]
MYFNVGKGIAIAHVKVPLFLLYSFLLAGQVNANEVKTANNAEVTFTALPEQCVTLRQGRDCFATVELQWHSSTKQSFCLYQEGKNKQLGCWQNNNQVLINVEFQSNKTIKYQLRTVSDNKVIAETQVEVSWQHKNTARKRRWRLF